jgi:uncharacterized protein YjbJ (UPF0337 family)
MNFLPQGSRAVDALKGNWTQLRGHIRMQWGKLTDDQLNVIEGRREVLLGKLQEAYGISAEEAERQVREWESAGLPGGDPADAVPPGRA